MSIAQNKLIVEQYNNEVIGSGNMELLQQIVAPDFINHSALPGMPGSIDGLIYFFTGILHPAFPGLKVEIQDMIAEGDKVTTRKVITGVHNGPLMDMPATGREVTIKVIDILTIENGKIREHWGENNFGSVMRSLQG